MVLAHKRTDETSEGLTVVHSEYKRPGGDAFGAYTVATQSLGVYGGGRWGETSTRWSLGDGG